MQVATHTAELLKPTLSLCEKNLPLLASRIPSPLYQRSQVTSSILHLGVGNFHRSHQAYYTDLVLHESTKWGITGVGLLHNDLPLCKSMKAQDCLYSLTNFDGKDNSFKTKIVGSILDFLHLPTQRKNILEKLLNPQTKIVSLTVTEKGYSQDVSKNLDLKDPRIQHDLKNLNHSQTAIGLIVKGLKDRKDKKLKPFSVLCCDNLQENGDMVKQLVLQFAQQYDSDLKKWIEENAKFPNTMVDRITPKVSKADSEFLHEKLGIIDSCPVKAEDYCEWVIEDNFTDNKRPSWEKGNNVRFVKDVTPFELMKLRLLNGGHVALANLSIDSAYENVDEAMKNKLLRDSVRRYMDEATPTLRKVDVDLEWYKNKLIQRFSNKDIGDQLDRLRMDGFKKITDWLGPVIKHLLQKNLSTQYTSLVVASWIKYMSGINLRKKNYDINDPEKDRVTPLAKMVVNSPDFNPKEFISSTFGNDLANSNLFVESVQSNLKNMMNKGIPYVLENT